MAIKTLRVFAEYTSTGFVPMPTAGNIDYGYTLASTFPSATPSSFQTDDPDLDVTVTAMTDFYVWIRINGTAWNPSYTRNVRVYPDSPDINNVVMNMIIATGPAGTSAYSQIVQTSNRLYFNGATVDTTYDSKFAGKTYINELNFGTAPQLATVATSGAYADLTGKPALSTVATSGLYTDLSAKPSGTAPISYNSGTNSFEITQASTSTNGFLSSTDWNTFNNKQGTITLTTSGTSGASTFVGNTLNIPNYAPNLSVYVPYTGATTNVNLGTHSLTAADLVVNHVSGSGVAASITKGGSGEALTVVKTSGSGNAASITGGVTLLDELHLNTDLVDAYIASATNWNTAYTNRIVSASAPLSITSNAISISQANTTTNGFLSSTDWNTFNSKQNALTLGNITEVNSNVFMFPDGGVGKTIGNFSIQMIQASATYNGYLSSTDWTTFNNKQNAITLTTTGTSGAATFSSGTLNIPQYQTALTNPVTGTGTTNYVTKWTSNSAVGNSLIFDNGTNVGIGTDIPLAILSSANTGALTLNSNDGNHTGFGLYIQAPSTTNTISSAIGFGVAARKLAAIAMQSYADADQVGLNFYVQPSASGSAAFLTEAMRITSVGNVLIGTTTDSGFKLDVVGTGRFNGSVTANNAVFNGVSTINLKVQNAGTANTSVLIQSYGSEVAGENASILFKSASNNTDTTYAKGLVSFVNNGTGAGRGSLIFALNNSASSTQVSASDAKLTIDSTGAATFSSSVTATAFIPSGATVPTNGMYLSAANTLNFATASTERIRITSTGNVGIGTTSPSSKLQIQGTGSGAWLTINRTDTGSNIVDFTQSGTRLGYLGYIGNDLVINNAATSNIQFNTAGSERIRITSTGNVGIGTASPATKLHISGAGAQTLRIENTNTSIVLNDIIGSIVFQSNDASVGGTGVAGSINSISEAASGVNYGLGFNTKTFATEIERMRITAEGNVGIGTGSPTGARLDIREDNNNNLRWGGTTTQYGFISYDTNLAIIGSIGASTSIGFWTNNSAERMRITSAGQVLIGRTTSTPAVGSLEVETNTIGGNTLILNSSGSIESSIYLRSVGSATRSTIVSNVPIAFITNDTERMRITQYGNVLVNATSSAYGASNIGYNFGVKGTNNQSFISIARANQTLDSEGIIVGLDTSNAYMIVHDNIPLNFSTNAIERMRITAGGNILMGTTTNNGERLYVSGSIRATGNITANSDLTLKKNLKLVDNPIDKLNQLNGYLYQWKENDEYQYGVIAQEVEKILPHAVQTGKNGIKGVAYNQLIPVLIEAVKEQNKKIIALEAKLG
jgi:Chaperone of endosialidase